MKIKKSLIFLTIILAVTCLFVFSNRVNAATISDDGKYSLVLIVNDDNASIDGEYAKLIRFNVAEGETTVKLSELTKGIIPFNGKTEFSHWETSNNVKASEELAKERARYYALLNGIRGDNPDWYLWINFFLNVANV